MTPADRDLLALAAKAYGIEIDGWTKCNLGVEVAIYLIDGQEFYWQPLLNNALTDCMGDALRLAIHCGIDFYEGDDNGPAAYAGYFVKDSARKKFVVEPHGKDKYAATGRAIVRAAAEIGKTL